MATKHPKFQRPNLAISKRVKDVWRKPHGDDNKQGHKLKWAGAVPKIGYQGAAEKRHLHPQGKLEFFVRNLKDLDDAEKLKNFVLRLSATLSARKKEQIRKKASELNLKVLN